MTNVKEQARRLSAVLDSQESARPAKLSRTPIARLSYGLRQSEYAYVMQEPDRAIPVRMSMVRSTCGGCAIGGNDCAAAVSRRGCLSFQVAPGHGNAA
jgi:hypothetical protein